MTVDGSVEDNPRPMVHTIRATEYTIAVVPEGHPLRARFRDMDCYTVTISWRGKPWNDPDCTTDDRWAVCSHGRVLNSVGDWTMERSPSNRTINDYKTTRFPLVEAQSLAGRAAVEELTYLETKHAAVSGE